MSPTGQSVHGSILHVPKKNQLNLPSGSSKRQPGASEQTTVLLVEGGLGCLQLGLPGSTKTLAMLIPQSKRGVSCVTQECICDFNFTVLNKSTANKRHTDIPDLRRTVPCFSSNLLMLPPCAALKRPGEAPPNGDVQAQWNIGDLGLITPRIVYVCCLCKSDKFSSQVPVERIQVFQSCLLQMALLRDKFGNTSLIWKFVFFFFFFFGCRKNRSSAVLHNL